ncbi:MAG: penicillin-binding protein activator [Pseudomonadota bacterium]
MSACETSAPAYEDPAGRPAGDVADWLQQAANSTNPEEQLSLRLNAAEALIRAADYPAALAALDTPPPPATGDYATHDRYNRLNAQALYGTNQYRAAQDALAGLNNWQPADYLLMAQVCASLQDYRCSADGYIQAAIELGMDHPQLPADINEIIWQNLSRAQQGPAMFTHRYHHAWWLLQQQIRAAGSIPAQQVAWQQWQRRYPSHPARLRPPRTLERLNTYQPPDIAVFLPLSGPVGTAGTAVRDGLTAAYINENDTSKPNIRFYDTAAGDIAELWEQAIAAGAEVTVGPLLKDTATRFAELTAYATQPRLLLNYLDEIQTASPSAAQPTPPSEGANTTNLDTAGTAWPLADKPALFQFGIAIEDEARALANHVLLQGHEKLIIVHSNSRWSRRAADEYTQQWPYAITQASFADIQGLTEAIGEAMQVAASETRKDEIANILGQPLEFLARGRQDMDAIVAFTNQVEARALIPALKFHFASQLPVYATSQAARGPELARLAGFNLTEMPLFAEDTAEHQALNQAFTLQTNAQAELYALGFDAYRLATWLPLLEADGQLAVPATSGYLWLDGKGKFKRDLNLNVVNKGGKLVAAQPY